MNNINNAQRFMMPYFGFVVLKCQSERLYGAEMTAASAQRTLASCVCVRVCVCMALSKCAVYNGRRSCVPMCVCLVCLQVKQ